MDDNRNKIVIWQLVDTYGNSGWTGLTAAGHSQGGMMPRCYVDDLGGAAKVNDLVALARHYAGGSPAGSPA